MVVPGAGMMCRGTASASRRAGDSGRGAARVSLGTARVVPGTEAVLDGTAALFPGAAARLLLFRQKRCAEFCLRTAPGQQSMRDFRGRRAWGAQKRDFVERHERSMRGRAQMRGGLCRFCG